MSVIARIEPLTIPTYPVGEPEKNPLFFEKRVYQGSNGKVYPVPFIDKVMDEPVDVTYQSVLLENDFIRLVMLPEMGGRIFKGQDKTNNDYDFFYRQDVIKPALVGLAGPWISGGVEFNWPQHHRPGTFLPCDVHIEEEADGARTVWMSELDPLNRLKGMHGIRIRPDSSLIELRARLYNRTPVTQTFLWWANIAAMVHDDYQAIFPADVHYVADHAIRATSSFPIANNPYYDIDYQNRPGANDLSWYKNIPVPTSYMVCQTNFDFFGGFDFKANGGFLHIANKHVSPGKKQWTWGDDEFGYAWDRELTDTNGPYVELMAGVFTDNQPDFSFLAPYETKTFSQFFWPIQDIGMVQQATTQAALACQVHEDNTIHIGLCVSKKIEDATLSVECCGETIAVYYITLSPGESWRNSENVFTGKKASDLKITLFTEEKDIISFTGIDREKLTQDREKATEPASPEDTESIEELFLTGEHLEQYRHPTRNPEDYWNEGLRRDPANTQCHTALGKRAYNRGMLDIAENHFRKAIARLTHRHPNPSTGEALYYLGLSLHKQGKLLEAYDHYYKSTWNNAWRAAASYQLACIDSCQGKEKSALEHIENSLITCADNNKAHVLKAILLKRLGKNKKANKALNNLLKIDPLDHWARCEKALLTDNKKAMNKWLKVSRNDAQTILDIAFDYLEAGCFEEAQELLIIHHQTDITPVAVPNPLERSPVTHYLLAHLTNNHLPETIQSPDYFFPSRLDEMLLLESVTEASSLESTKNNQSLEDSATFTPTYLNPNTEVQKHRNQLPHWKQQNATYAITFRLADSLPQSIIQKYLAEKNELKTQIETAQENHDLTLAHAFSKQLDNLYQSHIETALNQHLGECHMREPAIATIIANAITHFDGDRYDLAAWCVMPNHVHLILRPIGDHQLSQILQSIKSYSAQQANKALGRGGVFWMKESYDHIIRDQDDFINQRNYLKRNPEKAKLNDWSWSGVKDTVWASDLSPVTEASSLESNQNNPSLEDSVTLEHSATNSHTSHLYALGNYYFDKKRHSDAIRVWELAVKENTTIPQVYRNLGIAYWNNGYQGEKAAEFYQKAIALDSTDARFISEFDQLSSKRNRPLAERLTFLETHRDLVDQRDDATIALAELYNQTAHPQNALDLILSRRFHPWEGGEGTVLKQYTTAHLLLGQEMLDSSDPKSALSHFTAAMETPESLGEAYHPLQAKADVNYWIGRSLKALGREKEANSHFLSAAEEIGDFSGMAAVEHGPLSYYRGMALIELGRSDDAQALFESIIVYGKKRLKETAKIDYFATSLPNLLVFDEDLQARHNADAQALIQQATKGTTPIIS